MHWRGILWLLYAVLNELELPNHNATLMLDASLSFGTRNASPALADVGPHFGVERVTHLGKRKPYIFFRRSMELHG